MSKLNQEKLREQIEEVIANKSERKFTQSYDLQVMLRDYNPMKEKRINSMIDLNHQVRTNQKVLSLCFLALEYLQTDDTIIGRSFKGLFHLFLLANQGL